MSGAVEQGQKTSRSLVVRRALATVASLFAVGVFIWVFRNERLSGVRWLAPAVMAATPAVAGVAIWSGRLGLQLLSRGIWWSLLLLGAVVAATETQDYSGCGIALASACGLLLSGRAGLDGRGRFQPVAFGGTLTLALVLAIADAATLLYFGLATMTLGNHLGVIVLVPPMIAGIVGLLRLRTWGLLVSLACNVLVALLAATRVLPVPQALRNLLIGTAVLQLLVPIPMWVAIARRRIPPPDRWRRARVVASTAVIVAIALTSVAFSLLVERTMYDY